MVMKMMMLVKMESFEWRVQVTILAALCTLATFHLQVSGTDPPRNIPDEELKFLRYSIVIDAGSSGSRIHVYNWDEFEDRGQLPDFRHIYSYRTRPGVSECRSDSEIKKHILTLINSTIPYVPEKLQSSSPIYFMATAGMRMMLEDKANSATRYIDELMSNASLNPFLYRSPDNAKVLSGEEEGIFAWISANYLGKVFATYGKKSMNTRGILELGGASTQIAFAPRGNIFDNKFPVTVAGVTYSLYVHSYLIYGQEQVDMWINERVYQEAEHSAKTQRRIENPCMLIGDSTVRNISGVDTTFVGSGDPSKCLKLIDQLIYKPIESWRCNPKPCGIGSTYQPTIKPTMNFYVMGAFLYPLKALNVLKSDGTFSLQNTTVAIKKFCSTPMSNITMQRSIAKLSREERLLSRECLTGLYMPVLFEKAYGFTNDTKQLRAPVESPNSDIEWPLGAVIYEYEQQRRNALCPKVCASSSGASPAPLHPASVDVFIVKLICGLILTATAIFDRL